MAEIVVTKADPGRFPGDFQIGFTADAKPSAEETAYVARVQVVLTELLAAHNLATASMATRSDVDPAYSKAVLDARLEIYGKAASELKDDADRVVAGGMTAAEALENVELIRATHVVRLERLSKKLFFVMSIPEMKPGSDSAPAEDLKIVVKDGLPPPENEASKAKQVLLLDIYGVMTVIKAMCRDIARAEGQGWWTSLMRGGQAEIGRAARTRNECIEKLVNIGQLGLSGSQTLLATSILQEFKREIVSQEAGRIKNGYAAALGVRALICAIFLAIPYFLIVTGKLPFLAEGDLSEKTFGGRWWDDHKSFFLAGIGAAAGAWLSFSIRNVQLTFEQLGSVETDLLNPSLRIIFVLGLTLAAYLLFWTGALGISVGNLNASVDGLKASGSIAFLVGLFCGLSERALATAISGRSDAFVGGIDVGKAGSKT